MELTCRTLIQWSISTPHYSTNLSPFRHFSPFITGDHIVLNSNTPIKTMVEAIAEGQRIQYNFVKPHMALKCETSPKNVGVEVKGKNKWMDLLDLTTK